MYVCIFIEFGSITVKLVLPMDEKKLKDSQPNNVWLDNRGSQ